MRPVPVSRLTAASLLLFLASATALRAQEAPSPDGPPPPSKAAPQQEREGSAADTLKLNVNLVNVYFSARDKNGFVAGLGKEDCQVYEDNKLQTIKNLTQEKNLPLTIGILLDTSGSQQRVLPLEQESGARFLKEVLTPKDEAFLISFDVNVDLLADYTNSPRELTRAIDKASINTASSSGGIPGIGGMLIKALWESDFPTIKALTVVTSIAYMFFNLLSDVLYSVVDPRIKLS